MRIGDGIDYLKGKAEKGDLAAQKELEPLSTIVNVTVWEAFRLLDATRDDLVDGFSSLKVSEIVSVLDVFKIECERQRLKIIRQIVGMDIVCKNWKMKNG